MTYYITDPCIGTKDTACVEVCPVDCIHPKKEEADFPASSMLYIDPDTCIDCGACVPVCPVQAIYPGPETPASQKLLTQANELWYKDKAGAEKLVKQHEAEHPELMALEPKDRAVKHGK